MLSILDFATYAVAALIAAIYGYAAYSAFAIGRTLPARLYRRQALGVGLVAIIIVASLVSSVFYPSPSSTGSLFLAVFILLYAVFLGIFYWIDASVRGARLTDPLLRDTLHWSRLRIAFWAYDIVATAVLILLVFLGRFSFQGPPSLLAVAALLPFFITFFAGIVVLPIASHRSKDRTLRRHLDWFGLYAAVIFSFFFVSGPILGGLTGWANVAGSMLYACAGYFLYRSARSLVPLYTFTEVRKE